jgi:ribosomal protein L7/L12
MNLPDELNKQILLLCEEKKTIHAIKLVHQYTKWSLAKSKEYVEMLVEKGIQYSEETTNQNTNQNVNEALAKKILELCKNNKKIEAVKLVHEQTNWGLKESKDFVDSLIRYTEQNLTEDTSGGFYEMIAKIHEDTE